MLILTQVLPNTQAEGMARISRNISMGIALAVAVITTLLFIGHWGSIDWTNITQGGYVLQNDAIDLIPSIGVTWKVGADALSFPMIWLTTVLIPISMLVEWNAKRGHLFHPLLLVMEGALLGVFVVLDLFVFYVFWELTLIPMFLLILMWGGEDRRYAAMKFFIYTFAASVIMLVGILVMYFHTDPIAGLGSLTGHHFDLVAMTAQNNLIPSEGLRHLVWLMLLIGFATKMPSVPVHTWLPDAHVQAPTAGSMLLAGVMLKMGAYGFLRVAVTIFPESTIEFIPLLLVLGMASLVYGAWVCMSDQSQANGRLLLSFSHGPNLPRYSHNATTRNRGRSLHDVRTRHHQPSAVRGSGRLQAPLPHTRDRLDARHRSPQPLAGRTHDAGLDGEPRPTIARRIRRRGSDNDSILDDIWLACSSPCSNSNHHGSILPILDAEDDFRIQRPGEGNPSRHHAR